MSCKTPKEIPNNMSSSRPSENLENVAVVQGTTIAKYVENSLRGLRGVYRRCVTWAASLGVTVAVSYTYFGLLLADKLPKPLSPPPPPSSLEETVKISSAILGTVTVTVTAAVAFAYQAREAAKGIKKALEELHANQNYPELKV